MLGSGVNEPWEPFHLLHAPTINEKCREFRRNSTVMDGASISVLGVVRFARGSSNAIGSTAQGGRWKVNTAAASAYVFRLTLRGADDLLGTLTTFEVAHQNSMGLMILFEYRPQVAGCRILFIQLFHD